MSADNQIEIPPSFIALHIAPGRSVTTTPKVLMLARYEQCEDMASLLTEHAQTLLDKENLAPQDVLLRCYRGLLADAENFNAPEAQWVVTRLAEFMGWPWPAWGDETLCK